jgi:hypothetical protein
MVATRKVSVKKAKKTSAVGKRKKKKSKPGRAR